MSGPANPHPSRQRSGVGAALAAVLTAALLASMLVVQVATAEPAAALHQHCGDDLGGTGSLPNGHPDPDAHNGKWGGIGVIHELEATLHALSFARGTIGDIVGTLGDGKDVKEKFDENLDDRFLMAGTPASQIYAATGDLALMIAGIATDIVITALIVVNIILFVAETAVDAALFVFNSNVSDEGNCGGTLMGDTMHMQWVQMVQRNLASHGPPLAILMLPSPEGEDDADFPVLPQHDDLIYPWCPPIPGQTEGDDPCESTVQLGYLNAQNIGVLAIVENTIAHVESHQIWGAATDDRVTRAEAEVTAARGKIDAQQYHEAFYHLRYAYQVLTELTY